MVIPQEYLTTIFLIPGSPTPLPKAFAIITAWNPMDRKTPAKENLLADEALRRSLELRHVPYFRALGCSPDLSHREPGWAAELTKKDALTLGRRYGQRAIWWVEGDDLQLLMCEDGSETSAGTFRRRVRPLP